MFWQEDEDEIGQGPRSDSVDCVFRLRGKTLPADHAYAIAEALFAHAPWLDEAENLGVQLIAAMEEGNGWAADNGPEAILYLPRRARLVLRLPRALLEQAAALQDCELDVAGHRLHLENVETREFSLLATQYARHIVTEMEDEEAFLSQIARELQEMGVACRKMLCGRERSIKTPSGLLRTRSLMLADLSKEDALVIQQQGIGPQRHLGCGFFVPHKAIK